MPEGEPAQQQTRKGPLPGKLRYSALLLSCFLAFGGYLVYDLCSAVKKELTEDLHIDDTKYSLLYVVYAWTNCCMVLFAGALIDNTSNRGCALLFCTIACIGQSILALGVQLKQFYVMLAGRVIFGMGLGSICVAQNTISNSYFRDADLATAFAATLTVSRVGSVTNFFLSTYIYTWFGKSLPMVFWFGTATTALSVLCAVCFFVLDRSVEKKGLLVSAIRKSKKINWKDLAKFPPIYWLLCVICSLYYINIFALMAVIVEYLYLREHPVAIATALSSSVSSSVSSGPVHYDHRYSIISSIIYLVAIPCVPIFGRIIDNFGKRLIFLAISVATMIPFNAYLVFTNWTPIPALVVAGMSYSMVASSLWPSICMVVRDEAVGTANGIATSIQMIGIGCANLLVGFLKKKFSYNEVMWFFLACSILATLLTILANIIDKSKMDGRLNNYVAIKAKAKAEAEKQASPAGASETTPLVINADQKK